MKCTNLSICFFKSLGTGAVPDEQNPFHNTLECKMRNPDIVGLLGGLDCLRCQVVLERSY